jgi:uncharacterized membrane protein
MIRQKVLHVFFQLTEQEKKYLLVIVGLFLLGLLGRFFFLVNDTPFVSEPYQKSGLYE